MKGGTLCVVMLVLVCSLAEGKKAKHRQTRAAEEVEDLRLNNDLVRTKRKSEGPALNRVKRLQEKEPELPELNRYKRTKRSLPHIRRPQISERTLSRKKRVPKEAVLHRAKRVRVEKTLRRIKRLRRDLRTELMRHRRNIKAGGKTMRIPIMKRGHNYKRMMTRPDKKNQARMNRMRAILGNHRQQHGSPHILMSPVHKKNDIIHKKNDVMHKKSIKKKSNTHHKSNKLQTNKDKKHHVQRHAN